jgi:hypothetical protein
VTSRGIATALFLAHPETPRREIDEWAVQLRRALAARAAWPAGSRDHVARVIGSTNAAALLEAHRGDLQAADDVCRSQLDWLAAHPRARRFDVARHALNPWLNLGRLASMRGDVSAALEIFAVLRPGRRAIRMGVLTLARRRLDAQLKNELGYPDFAAHVYLTESLRTFARAGDADALRAATTDRAMLRAGRRAGGNGMLLLSEARLLALRLDGDFPAVARDATDWRDRTAAHARAVFGVRAADAVIAARSSVRQCDEALRIAEQAIVPLLEAEPPAMLAVSLANHAARLAHAAGRPVLGARVARRAMAAAARTHDVVLRYEALGARALGEGRAATAAAQAQASLLGGTAYRMLTQRTTTRSPAMEALAAEVRSSLA